LWSTEAPTVLRRHRPSEAPSFGGTVLRRHQPSFGGTVLRRHQPSFGGTVLRRHQPSFGGTAFFGGTSPNTAEGTPKIKTTMYRNENESFIQMKISGRFNINLSPFQRFQRISDPFDESSFDEKSRTPYLGARRFIERLFIERLFIGKILFIENTEMKMNPSSK